MYPWNKGKSMSDEQKLQISETLKRKGIIPPSRKGMTAWNKGLPTGEETKAKISSTLSGRTLSEETREKMSKSRKGEKCHFWKGGVTPIHKAIRMSKEYKEWRKSVFERDNYTCVLCGNNRSGELNADHIKPFYLYPKLRLEINNGRTLCKPCHKETDTYGRKALSYQIT